MFEEAIEVLENRITDLKNDNIYMIALPFKQRADLIEELQQAINLLSITEEDIVDELNEGLQGIGLSKLREYYPSRQKLISAIAKAILSKLIGGK